MKSSQAVLALVTLLITVSSYAAPIKMSKSGICHTESSPYYEKTRKFTSFPSVKDCISAGGRLPRGKGSAATPSADPGVYSREKFGSGWADTDGDCQDSRNEALIAQSTAPVQFKSGRGCRVSAGRWISPFTGQVIHDPSAIDIDHIVPLKWAWQHGADRWSQAKRERFANTPANLVSVEASLNRSKGSRGPDRWLPPTNQCQYIARFLRVVKKYDLITTPNEQKRYQELRAIHCS